LDGDVDECDGAIAEPGEDDEVDGDVDDEDVAIDERDGDVDDEAVCPGRPVPYFSLNERTADPPFTTCGGRPARTMK